ncbi:MAG: excinuclease ABC subunit UvrB [Planctomycetes bacterium]|nr:excinuclease ABC subunit UvrB [Planctomycetota bacterium]
MSDSPFKIVSDFEPAGDQPRAIASLEERIRRGENHSVLMGVTGSGKTFSMAQLISNLGRPTVILAHNKTLATQLYGEFKELFPHNAVEYFVSYYDYYQPEAYIPGRDLYIEKDASINKQLEKMRHSTTRSILERPDVIVVCSVSCIYGLGSPSEYRKTTIFLSQGKEFGLSHLLARLVEIQYRRNDLSVEPGHFRVRGDVVDIFPVYEDQLVVRVAFFGDEVESIQLRDPLTRKTLHHLKKIEIMPASHYVTDSDHMKSAIRSIRDELAERMEELGSQNKELERQRLAQRVCYDLEMMEQTGFCSGIENYSRHLTGSQPGQPPYTLFDYLPEDYLLMIDESHVSIPQVRGMFNGDRSRKETLVAHGFRLPSALDSRPLRFPEFEALQAQRVYISATPGDYELGLCKEVVEQIIRPTGLSDPQVEVRPIEGQVEDLLGEILIRTGRGERVLVTTLTKRMAEDLTRYLIDHEVRTRYLHSDIDVLERSRIIRNLRKGEFDVLVGINLLREGLDLPEVSLVAILDADKEGFLRSRSSLIQTMGRAARHLEGKAILYADRETPAMKAALEETGRRRLRQQEYNREHGITPRSIRSNIKEVLTSIYERDYLTVSVAEDSGAYTGLGEKELRKKLEQMSRKMRKLAGDLEFEAAAALRDEIRELEKVLLSMTKADANIGNSEIEP